MDRRKLQWFHVMCVSVVKEDGPRHLFVLLHGFGGNSSHVAALANCLRSRLGGSALVVCPSSFSILKTYDGIDVCSERVLSELRPLIKSSSTLRTISLIGYSMGGLMARYLAGALYVESFLGLLPLNLATVACPHLGPSLVPRQPGEPSDSGIMLSMLRRLGGRSGSQMALSDPEMLLPLMCHPRSVFYAGLRAFARRAAYASAAGDNTVPFWSAFIAPWVGGKPSSPPPGEPAEHAGDLSAPSDYPHIEWDCVVDGGAPGAPSEGGAAEDTPMLGQPDALSGRQRLQLSATLAVLVPVALPLWLTLIAPTVLVVGLLKREARHRSPPKTSELLVLRPPSGAPPGEGEQRWLDVLGDETCASKGPLQAWMAAQLNSLTWRKTSVRFRCATDGLKALHTHGHIIVRNGWRNQLGMDIIRHLAEAVLTGEEPRVSAGDAQSGQAPGPAEAV